MLYRQGAQLDRLSSFAADVIALEALLAVATTKPQQVAEDHRQDPVEELVEHDGVERLRRGVSRRPKPVSAPAPRSRARVAS